MSETLREQFERVHATWLAPYAIREADSGGRKFPEAEHPYRTCFRRDCDRVLHSTAFRRLRFKTQVFLPHVEDHVRFQDYIRTRLTHTVEVRQVARTLAQALRLNEDLVEAVALAHDLGHPPFGHCGEQTLDELMRDHGGFEHNRQSLRVVDYLEHPYPRFRGLNLTRVVRECLAKHRTRYDNPVCPEFDPSLQGPLEGQVVDVADEIAYTSADLDDALAAGWLKVEDLGGLELWRRAWQVAQADAPDAHDIHKRIRACKAVLAMMADDVIATTARNLSPACGPRINSPDDVRHAGRPLVAFSDELALAVRAMQDLLLHQVYLHPRSEAARGPARRAIMYLFAAYVADPRLLPERYQDRVAADSLYRVVCDYIAGMTDRFCLQEHGRINGSANV
ncbi:MAG: deoxyguanosinetriphosphate triphosphohydrolase [Phycisphaerae bacterium]